MRESRGTDPFTMKSKTEQADCHRYIYLQRMQRWHLIVEHDLCIKPY